MENTTHIANSILRYTLSTLPNGQTPSHITFSWYDYILFMIMLGLSGLIGIYFGCFGTKQSTAQEYLMGSKKMKVIPVAISLVASHTSGITLLAMPADVYTYGAAYWAGSFSMILLAVITIYVYLPVFYNLKITSTYEYLERRFDVKTRSCASFLFAFSLFVYLPIVIYIPALAFSAASGIGVHYITPLVCGVCIFYTTLGGLKAVVWTDTLQFTITVGATIAVFILGTISVGGFTAVWNKALESGRLNVFDFDINPTRRETFWTIIIGLTVHWVAHTSVNQSCTQKFLAVPTLAKAKWTVFWYCIGMTLMKTLCVLTGLLMYKKYADCDPFTTKQVEKKDQLLPYFAMEVAGKIPGLSGLFIAGVFSAALSTLSANLNCIAGTLYEDFIKRCISHKTTEKTSSNILKGIVVITGIISTTSVYVVEHLGGLLNLSISLGSVAHGPLLGMFTLGVLCPRANGTGAFFASIISMICMAVVIFGAKAYQNLGYFKYPRKPLSTDGCDFDFNSTISSSFNSTLNTTPHDEPFLIFRISFYYYTLIGATITMVIGLAISYLTNRNDPPVDKKLLSPLIHFMVANKESKLDDKQEYYTVEKALEIIAVNMGNEGRNGKIS